MDGTTCTWMGRRYLWLKSETEGRAGSTPGQPARTRECAVRDEGSTTYVGGIETSEEFGLRIDTEAYHRGWDRACIRVAIGDGSHWIWNIADQHSYFAVQNDAF